MNLDHLKITPEKIENNILNNNNKDLSRIYNDANYYSTFHVYQEPINNGLYFHNTNAFVLYLALKFNNGYLVSGKDRKIEANVESIFGSSLLSVFDFNKLSIYKLYHDYISSTYGTRNDGDDKKLLAAFLEFRNKKSILNFESLDFIDDLTEDEFTKLTNIGVTLYGNVKFTDPSNLRIQRF